MIDRVGDQVIVIDSSEPAAGEFLRDCDVLRSRSEEGNLPFQVYLDGKQIVGFGIEEPDRVGLSESRKPAYALIPISTSPESLSELAVLSLSEAGKRGYGYVYSIAEADNEKVISGLKKGGLNILDEYFLMTRSLEDIEYVDDPDVKFDRVNESNVENFMRTFYEAFRDSPDRLVAVLFQPERATPGLIQMMREFFTKPDHYAYIIKYRGETVGILDMGKTFLNAIGLLPKYRRRGIGKLSMIFALSELRQRDQETVTLRVDVKNLPAVGLYKKPDFLVAEHRIRLFKSLQ